jgi:hypothetical protein
MEIRKRPTNAGANRKDGPTDLAAMRQFGVIGQRFSLCECNTELVASTEHLRNEGVSFVVNALLTARTGETRAAFELG